MELIKKILQSKNKPKKVSDKQKKGKESYFTLAKSWNDDIYTEAVSSRNRYKLAFYWAAGLASLLVFSIIMLVPLQHTELVVVHHYNDGTVWVAPSRQKYSPNNKAQTESEIVRYVVNRESYHPASYDSRYSLVALLSSSEVAEQYSKEQSVDNKEAPVNTLGTHGFRKVHVENVVFLDNKDFVDKSDHKTHSNLAQVSFRITDYSNDGAKKKSIPLTAILSWDYRGTPQNPEDMWGNWNGFTVTKFEVTQRNI